MSKYIKYMFFFSIIVLYSCCVDEDYQSPEANDNALTLNLVLPSAELGESSTRTDVSGSTSENYVKDCDIEIYKDDNLLCSFQHVTVTKLLNDSTYSFSLVLESREEAPDPVALKAKYEDAEIRVYANNDSYPSTETPLKTRPVSPFYMSGYSKISLTNDALVADVHLMRGVSKVRTVIRTTQRSQMGDWVIDYDDITYNMIRVAPVIRRLAPFKSHANDAVTVDLPITEYVSYDAAPQTDWTNADGRFNDLTSQVVLQDKREDGTQFDSTYVSCDQYVLENWLNDEEQYDDETNVTAMETVIKLHSKATGEVKTISRYVPITVDDSRRLLRNHIYTIDIQVLSPQDFDFYIDLSDWNVKLNGDILGDDIEFDRDKIVWINQGSSAYTTGARALVFTIQHRPSMVDLYYGLLDENKEVLPDASLGLTFYVESAWDNFSCGTEGPLEGTLKGYNYVSMGPRTQYTLWLQTYNNYFDSTTKEPIGPVPHYFKISYDGIDHYIPIELAPEPTPLDKEGTANCYIVEKPGIYSFDARSVGNGIEGVTVDNTFHAGYYYTPSTGTVINKANYNAIHPSQNYGPRVLFADQIALIDQVVFDKSTERIIFSISGTKPGNATIGIGNSAMPSNNLDIPLYWRWHIWYGPRPTDKYVKSSDPSIGYYAFMDRNIGATSVDDTSHATYYQYGNPMPFFNFVDGDMYYMWEDLKYAAGQYNSFKNVQSSYTSYANFPANERIGRVYKYYISTSDTDVDADSPFWGTPYSEDTNPVSQKKTIYDPCPVGYRVPSLQAYKDLIADETLSFTGDASSSTVNPSYFKFTGLPFSQGELIFSASGKITSNTTIDRSKIQTWTTGILDDGSTKKRAVVSYGYNSARADLISGSADGALLPVRCVRE